MQIMQGCLLGLTFEYDTAQKLHFMDAVYTIIFWYMDDKHYSSRINMEAIKNLWPG